MELEAGHDCTRVVLADLPGPGRTALAALIAHTPGAVLVGEVDDAEALAASVHENDAEVVVVDDRLLAGTEPGRTRMIVVGADDNPGFAIRAERLGALAWIPKERADSLLPLLLLHPDFELNRGR